MMIEDLFGATTLAIKELSPQLLYTISAARDEHGNINEVDWDSWVIAPENTAPVPTKAEILAKRNEIVAGAPMRRLRAARDQKLAETDWVVVRAVDRNEPIPPEWSAYRQALRDVTSNYSSLEDVVWPVKP